MLRRFVTINRSVEFRVLIFAAVSLVYMWKVKVKVEVDVDLYSALS